MWKRRTNRLRKEERDRDDGRVMGGQGKMMGDDGRRWGKMQDVGNDGGWWEGDGGSWEVMADDGRMTGDNRRRIREMEGR